MSYFFKIAQKWYLLTRSIKRASTEGEVSNSSDSPNKTGKLALTDGEVLGVTDALALTDGDKLGHARDETV